MQLCNEFWTCREMNYQQLGKLTYNEALLGQLQCNIIEPPILNIHCFWDDEESGGWMDPPSLLLELKIAKISEY